MNILITAGGTSEKIDDVRRITNSGTGRLGAKIAEAFAASGRECSITYLCSENAVRPEIRQGDGSRDSGDGSCCLASETEEPSPCPVNRPLVLICSDVDSVRDAVLEACDETAFDVIVHSMAIGDYRVKTVLDSLHTQREIRESKISSEKEELVVVLEKAPKIIALLRGLAPDAVIVGFKLLSEAGEEELVQAGHALLMKNDCDFVLANDIRTVRQNRHEGILITKDGTFEHAAGKEEIAALIVERVLERLSESGR